MKAYQCSKCENLRDYDEYCQCSIGIDVRPNHREKGNAELCKKNFKQLEERKQWHEKFSWE
jgi:hypothetical protein